MRTDTNKRKKFPKAMRYDGGSHDLQHGLSLLYRRTDCRVWAAFERHRPEGGVGPQSASAARIQKSRRGPTALSIGSTDTAQSVEGACS